MSPGLLGAFVPQCTVDGFYETRQCHGSTGHCWCVSKEGVELVGTRRGPMEEPVDCDAPGRLCCSLLFDTRWNVVLLFLL